MIVAVVLFELHIPYAQSLKDKRMVVRSLRDKLRGRFDVAANEGDSDLFRNACAATFEALRHRSCRRWKGAKLEPSRKPNLRR